MALQTATQAARVLIVDDQTLFRSGLAGLLNQDRRVHVVGEAVDGADAVKQAEALQPDVVGHASGGPIPMPLADLEELVRDTRGFLHTVR